MLMDKKSGFTLAELMVVIAIISIMSGIAVPNLIKWRNNQMLNKEARELHGIIRGLRHYAVKENAHTFIEFNSDSYKIKKIKSGTIPAKEIIRPIPENISLVAKFGKDNILGFTSQGRPSSGMGSVKIALANVGERKIVVNITGGSRIE